MTVLTLVMALLVLLYGYLHYRINSLTTQMEGAYLQLILITSILEAKYKEDTSKVSEDDSEDKVI